MSNRPHSVLVPHVRLHDTHGLIGTRPGCLACEERFGSDYANPPESPESEETTDGD